MHSCDKKKNIRTNIQLCDEEGCCQQAVVVLPDYSKCTDHDQMYRLQELVREMKKTVDDKK